MTQTRPAWRVNEFYHGVTYCAGHNTQRRCSTEVATPLWLGLLLTGNGRRELPAEKQITVCRKAGSPGIPPYLGVSPQTQSTSAFSALQEQGGVPETAGQDAAWQLALKWRL